MPTARELLLNSQKGRVGSMAKDLIDSTITTMTAAAAELNTACEKQDERAIAIDNAGAAATATHTKLVRLLDRKVKVKSFSILPQVANPLDATSYFTVQLVAINSTNAASTVTIGTYSLATTTLTANVPVSVSVTAANAEVSSGKVLAIIHTKVAGGSTYDYRVEAVVQEV